MKDAGGIAGNFLSARSLAVVRSQHVEDRSDLVEANRRLQRRIDTLEVENERVLLKLDRMKRGNTPTFTIPKAWNLSPVERSMLTAIASVRAITMDDLMSELYADRSGDWPAETTVRAAVRSLTTKLAAFDVHIVRPEGGGKGYSIKDRKAVLGRLFVV